MNALLVYMIKSAIFLEGFYLIYFLFLSRDTQYSRNRAFILFSVILSFILPCISFNIKENSTIAYLGKTLSEIIVTAEAQPLNDIEGNISVTDISGLLFKIYFAGAVLFGLKLLADVVILIVLIVRNYDGNKRVIKFRGFNTPGFSAFGYIFINRSLPDKDAEEIIRHEQTHLNRFHFFDILLIEIVKVLQWFNPVIYFINKSLRAVHEYQADDECINSGIGITGYRNLLMNILLDTRVFVASNSFSNPSLIRKRILMMTRKRSARTSNLKMVLAIPVIIALAFLISACEKQITEKHQTQENIPSYVAPPNPLEIIVSPPIRPQTRTISETTIPEPFAKNTGTMPESDKAASFQSAETNYGEITPEEVFVVVEEMPKFPGGETALMEFIYRNIQYPEGAKQQGIEGRVILRFCVNHYGMIDRISVIKGVHPLLDNEAVRVVGLLPQWEPGKQGSKPVNVWYSVPVTFALSK
ncbi:MAG: TonB family protein [Bacteroidales bacterium]